VVLVSVGEFVDT
jgi:hypothetical protein